jgi:hypothetical protein
MKDIATFVGGSGKVVAVIYETDGGFFQVNLSEDVGGVKQGASKFFKTEEEATQYASDFTSRGNESRLLSE